MTVVMSRRIRLVAKGGDGRYVFVTDEDDWYQITQDELEQMCADVADLNKRAALSRPPSEYGMSDEPACPKSPDGKHKHESVYEGWDSETYECKYCGDRYKLYDDEMR